MKPPSWTENPSKFTKEEANVWRKWNADDNGTTPHREIGSRDRPMSVVHDGATVDELWEQMVRKGIVAADSSS